MNNFFRAAAGTAVNLPSSSKNKNCPSVISTQKRKFACKEIFSRPVFPLSEKSPLLPKKDIPISLPFPPKKSSFFSPFECMNRRRLPPSDQQLGKGAKFWYYWAKMELFSPFGEEEKLHHVSPTEKERGGFKEQV